MKDNYDYEPSGSGLIIIIALIVIYMIVKVLL
jgi:hypothetical protein